MTVIDRRRIGPIMRLKIPDCLRHGSLFMVTPLIYRGHACGWADIGGRLKSIDNVSPHNLIQVV